jgi:dipeptidyl-peptidase-4
VSDQTYPRQRARTRGFSCGAPRLFTIAPDGARVVFVRSTSGTDTVGRLWVLDAATGQETLVADPAALHEGAEELSREEQARRERMREQASGVVGYATDKDATRAVFALSGGLYAASLTSAEPVHALEVAGPVIDPRLSPDGRHVAYHAHGALRLVEADGTGDRALVEPSHEHETCGLVDFAAAEELERSRGFWWSPASDALLVERFDVSLVQEWWIADPVHPGTRPYAHRYPSAGTPNAVVSLDLVRLDGSSLPVEWDAEALPYLVDVHWGEAGDPLVVLASREQKRFVVLAVDPATAQTRVVAEWTDPQWVDVFPGSVRWSPDGQLLTLRADRGTDTYRLHLGDGWLSPAGLQLRGVAGADDDGVLALAAPHPMQSALVRIRWDGSVSTLAGDGGYATGLSAGGTSVVVERRLGSTAVSYEVRSSPDAHAVESFAETPVVEPRVEVIEAGPDAILTAVLWPTGHEPGTRRLPVVLSPYGGPHHQEVLAAGGLYGEDQWLADQGFCVVVADGRGTPGRGPSWDRRIKHDLATGVLDDQVTALQAVAERWPDDVDTDRVAIRGWSFGGYLAALAVLARPDVFHAAVAGAPVTEWRLYDTAYTERYLGIPTDDAAPYDACSLIPFAPQLRRPLLIIHGLTDDNVVVAHTLALSGALTVHGRPHQVLPLSGVTHMTPQEEVAENKLLLELDFIRRSLGVA